MRLRGGVRCAAGRPRRPPRRRRVGVRGGVTAVRGGPRGSAAGLHLQVQ